MLADSYTSFFGVVLAIFFFFFFGAVTYCLTKMAVGISRVLSSADTQGYETRVIAVPGMSL